MKQPLISLLITNPTDRKLIADFLEESGYRIFISSLPQDRVEYQKETNLIIADERAARWYGQKLLALKWQSGVDFLPLLIVLPRGADANAWLKAGFDDVLRSPLTKAELKARLEVFFRWLRLSSENYREVFENALIGMYRATEGGELLMANRAMIKMFGYNSFEDFAADYQTRGAFRLQPDRAEFLRQFEKENVIKGVESSLIKPDGTELIVLESARIVRGEQNTILYIDGSIEDITARKRIEEEREQLLLKEQKAHEQAELISRAKDEFLTTISHELRTPLNAVLGWTRILSSAGIDEETKEKALEVINRNVAVQVALIEDLLDISKIISGKLRLEISALNLKNLIESAVDIIKPAAQTKSIELKTTLNPPINVVRGDGNRLQQVVWNLLSNAVKFTPNGGTIQISLEEVNSQVEIKVKDTGIGIEKDFLPCVFDRFQQADGSPNRQFGGLGLGLSIVKQLVELHGGAVEASSDGTGKGAAFTITLPIAQTAKNYNHEKADSLTNGKEPSEEHFNLKDISILVVDDEQDSRELIGFILERYGAKVKSAGCALEALRIIQEKKPDLLISDIGMPELDGYELIEKVRQLPPERGGAIPAIALTAYAGAEDKLKVVRAGFQTHVSKPVEPEELVTVVTHLASGRGDAKNEISGKSGAI